MVFLTAWEMLVHKVKLRPGETVLVWGGGSGVGSAAIQLVKALGGSAIAVVGSEAKANNEVAAFLSKSLGAGSF